MISEGVCRRIANYIFMPTPEDPRLRPSPLPLGTAEPPTSGHRDGDKLRQSLTAYAKKLSSLASILKPLPAGAELTALSEHGLQLRTADRLLQDLLQMADTLQTARQEIERQRTLVATAAERARQEFFPALDRHLRQHGMTLEGRLPDSLRVGFLYIHPDFERAIIMVRYNSDINLTDVKMDPAEVTAALDRVRRHLGSGLPPAEFAQLLREACRRCDPQPEAKVPIANALVEVTMLVQPLKFRRDPRRDNYKEYTRADFSYDLYRLNHPDAVAARAGIALITATRAYTQRAPDFMWVPDDAASGKGTTYSHIQCRR